MNLKIYNEFLSYEEIAPQKGYQIPELYVIIHRPGMEGGMFVGKHIHLDEQACSVHLNFVQPFPHGVSTRTS